MGENQDTRVKGWGWRVLAVRWKMGLSKHGVQASISMTICQFYRRLPREQLKIVMKRACLAAVNQHNRNNDNSNVEYITIDSVWNEIWTFNERLVHASISMNSSNDEHGADSPSP